MSWRRVRTDNAAATDGLLRGRQGLVAAAVPRPGGDPSVIILLFGGFSSDGGSGHHDPSSAIIAFDPRTSPAPPATTTTVMSAHNCVRVRVHVLQLAN